MQGESSSTLPTLRDGLFPFRLGNITTSEINKFILKKEAKLVKCVLVFNKDNGRINGTLIKGSL